MWCEDKTEKEKEAKERNGTCLFFSLKKEVSPLSLSLSLSLFHQESTHITICIPPGNKREESGNIGQGVHREQKKREREEKVTDMMYVLISLSLGQEASTLIAVSFSFLLE